MNIEKFKPNLIPNNGDGIGIEPLIIKNGGIREYIVSPKKDGVRLLLKDSKVLSRDLKETNSIAVKERFKPLSELCQNLGIILEGEFYAHGFKFNEIFRFYSNTDVTSEAEKKRITKRLYEYPGRSIEWLTTFHNELKFYWFDGIVLNEPELGYAERMYEITELLAPYTEVWEDILVLPIQHEIKSLDNLWIHYENMLSAGYEGLILVHKDHQYKFGRNTLNDGTLLKIKDDKNIYDGIVLDVEEGTQIKAGVERTVNAFGYSQTSGKKDDRESSGMAKGFVVEYNGERFTVSLKGFNNEDKIELLQNKAAYIGKHFTYSAMPPVKNVPRHAYFVQWRDAK